MENLQDLFDYIDGKEEDKQQEHPKASPKKSDKFAYKRPANEIIYRKNQQVYEIYRENRAKSFQLKKEILEGIKSGEPVETLLLKSLEVISGMTNDQAFKEQSIKDFKAIYGNGLNNNVILIEEMKDINNRIAQLKKTYEKESDINIRTRIKNAIKKHEGKMIEIEEKIIENGKQNQ